MSLELVKSALRINTGTMSLDSWTADATMQAEKIGIYRRAMEGDYDANLTTQMRRLMNITKSGTLHEFNANTAPIVVNTEADRIHLTGIEADNDTATQWIADILDDNEIDSLQASVNELALVDGNTFLLVDMEVLNPGTALEKRRVRFTHEPAFDGVNGVVVIYATAAAQVPLCAVKVWRVTTESLADTTRVNVYYANRIERFISRSATPTTLEKYNDDGAGEVLAWTLTGQAGGEAIGVPVVHFRNRGAAYDSYGLSELEPVVPLMNMKNKTLHSLVATCLLNGFPIRALIGAQADAGLTPGMIESFFAKDGSGNVVAPDEKMVEWFKAIRLEQWQAAEMTPFLDVLRWVDTQIYDITGTPDDDNGGDNASGESLKQREAKLIAKIKRYLAGNGTAWEMVAKLAWRVQQAFGAVKPPAYTRFVAQWDAPEVRDDQRFIADTLQLVKEGIIDKETALREIAPLRGWDEDKIQEILANLEAERAQEVADAVRGMADSVFGDSNASEKPTLAAAA